MALPEAYLLSRYRHWVVFGTGTFQGADVPKPIEQRKLVFAFLYQVANTSGIPFSKLVWVLRREFGEIGGRSHYHWLIGHSDWKSSISQMFKLMSIWQGVWRKGRKIPGTGLPRCGWCRCHLFDQRLNGVEYVTKCLSDGHRDTLAGDHYEGGKFQGSDDVTLSNSFLLTVGGKRVSVLRRERLTRRKKAGRQIPVVWRPWEPMRPGEHCMLVEEHAV